MRTSRVLATAFLVTVVGCGRSALHGGHAARPGEVADSGGVAGGTADAGGATAWSDGGAAGYGGPRSTGGAAATMGGGGSIPAVSGGGAPGTGGTSATGGTRPAGGSGTGGRSNTGGSSAGGSSAGGRTRPDASVGGSVGREGGPADVPIVDLPILSLSTGGTVGVDGPVATGGAPRVDGPIASGGVIASGGTTSQGGAAGTGGVVSSGGTGGSPGICGDGTIGPGEQCDLGADNAASAAFVVTQGGTSFPAIPFIQTGTGADFYSYSSVSAHTGYEAPGMSRIFLYLDKSTRVLSLIFFHGVDQDSSGLEQPSSTVQLLFSGLPDSTAIGISDDSNELIMTSSTTATGLWSFTNNSDGGVLHGFPLPGDWTITVEPYFIKGNWTWTWLKPDGSEIYLDTTQPLTIEARSKHGQCRSDCTIPQCGDGIWDGGEVCDDGQPSESGCSLNCMSFN